MSTNEVIQPTPAQEIEKDRDRLLEIYPALGTLAAEIFAREGNRILLQLSDDQVTVRFACAPLAEALGLLQDQSPHSLSLAEEDMIVLPDGTFQQYSLAGLKTLLAQSQGTRQNVTLRLTREISSTRAGHQVLEPHFYEMTAFQTSTGEITATLTDRSELHAWETHDKIIKFIQVVTENVVGGDEYHESVLASRIIDYISELIKIDGITITQITRTGEAIPFVKSNQAETSLPAEVLAPFAEDRIRKTASYVRERKDQEPGRGFTSVGTFPTKDGSRYIITLEHKDSSTLNRVDERIILTDIAQYLRYAFERIFAMRLAHSRLTEAEKLARTDELTGLLNLRGFLEKVIKVWKRALETGSDICYAMPDIDLFKRFNDIYTHSGGDIVLQEVAKILRECFRDVDILGRIGGEEFGVFFTETQLKEAIFALERFRSTVEQTTVSMFVNAENVTAKVSISCSAVSIPNFKLTKEIIRDAIDRGALYVVKNGNSVPGKTDQTYTQKEEDAAMPISSLAPQDLGILLQFAIIRAVASRVTTLAKEHGRNRTFSAQYSSPEDGTRPEWQILDAKGNIVETFADINVKPIYVSGTQEDLLAMAEQI